MRKFILISLLTASCGGERKGNQPAQTPSLVAKPVAVVPASEAEPIKNPPTINQTPAPEPVTPTAHIEAPSPVYVTLETQQQRMVAMYNQLKEIQPGQPLQLSERNVEPVVLAYPFAWDEVNHTEGLVPLFEETVEVGVRYYPTSNYRRMEFQDCGTNRYYFSDVGYALRDINSGKPYPEFIITLRYMTTVVDHRAVFSHIEGYYAIEGVVVEHFTTDVNDLYLFPRGNVSGGTGCQTWQGSN